MWQIHPEVFIYGQEVRLDERGPGHTHNNTDDHSFPSSGSISFPIQYYNSDMQGLVWGEPELAHEYVFVFGLFTLPLLVWHSIFLALPHWHSLHLNWSKRSLSLHTYAAGLRGSEQAKCHLPLILLVCLALSQILHPHLFVSPFQMHRLASYCWYTKGPLKLPIPLLFMNSGDSETEIFRSIAPSSCPCLAGAASSCTLAAPLHVHAEVSVMRPLEYIARWVHYIMRRRSADGGRNV